jgi:hypothetical protein
MLTMHKNRNPHLRMFTPLEGRLLLAMLGLLITAVLLLIGTRH